MNGFWRVILTALLIMGWVTVGYYYADYTLDAPKRTKTVTVEIEHNTSINQIGHLLKEKKLIRESYFFRYYAWYKNMSNLKAGVYEIKADQSLSAIISKLYNGEQDLTRVDVPPGWTILEVANRLGSHGYDKEGFLKAIKERKPVHDFEKAILNLPNRKFRLEGYLDASRYYFRKDEKPEIILDTMVNRFAQKLDRLHLREKIPQGMTLDQCITVASLIQRESEVLSELPRIAGVIYNRLKDKANNRLQLDATSVYAVLMKEGKKPKNIKRIHNEIDDPYNTYKNPGLPPGPIATVTDETLLAAVNPEKNEFEFYTLALDGTNNHLFATSFEEHKKNIEKSIENSKKNKSR